ncbi:MAG TPA: metallophosphoesterase family protein [Candidatus Limnocylindrales bacterium]
MRIVVLSDVHANLAALEAVLLDVGSVDAIWHLGDAVGYGPQPQAVVDRLRGAGAVWVRGNHDDAAGGGESIELFNPDGYRAMQWTRAHIAESTREYLAGLPEVVTPEGLSVTLTHGSPSNPIWEYLNSATVANRNLPYFETQFCLVGHTHVALAFKETRGTLQTVHVRSGSRLDFGEKRAILNPGSVGQPRDGDARAGYMVIDTSSACVSWHRAEYDIGATQTAMAEAGLPHSLVRRLSIGR